MSIKKGDNRSVRHTKKRIKEGLIELMREKPIQNISVKELTEHIDLNRGTFYFHYRDIYDLLNQLEDELLDELQKVLIPNIQSPHETVEALFLFLKENADLCSITLGASGDMNFVERTKDTVAQTLIKIWNSNNPGIDPKEYEFFDAYIINGFIGIVQLWYESGMVRSPHDMAVFAADIISASFDAFSAGDRQ